MSLDILNVPYTILKTETAKKGLRLFYITLHSGYCVLAGSVTYILKSNIIDSNVTDFESNYKSIARSVSCEAEVQGLCSPLEADGKPLIATTPAEGLKLNAISPNWCDRTTWYEQSVRIVNEEMITTDLDRKVWETSHKNITDTYHGKLTGEDNLSDADGYSYRVLVTADGYEKTEQNPHYGSGGDFTVNYKDGYITFFESIPVEISPLITYHYENGSRWTIKPTAGEVLKLKRAEAQFSEDVVLTDTLVYDLYGSVNSFAPQYVYYRATGTVTFTNNSNIITGVDTLFTTEIIPGQYIRYEGDGPECYMVVATVDSNTQITLADIYVGSSTSGSAAYSTYPSGVIPSETLIQLVGADKYKTIYDYYNDANGCYPEIPVLGGTNWRAAQKKVYSFPWDFQTTTDFRSSSKMELRVYLEHDTNYGGTYATGTFYLLRVNE
jgi:hypothetical protein